jgi:alkanesulfonate monooxygenase SsuD/methylene tetrahydromethanopterin reductase-like flavin-dependent oxidoreductase (luciferase family)
MRVGFALRSTVFTPSLVRKAAARLDEAGADSIWFPDVGGSYDALDLCGVALGATLRARAGTGVIRAGEQDPVRLAMRARTLSESSGGRFVLGLGSGRATGPAAIDGVVALARRFEAEYRAEPRPPVFFAALRGGMVRAAVSAAEGAILNFCPPSHAEKVSPRGKAPKGFTLACYVKVFFAPGDLAARRMLLEEVDAYDRYPAYHGMFAEAGLSEAIDHLEPASGKVPDELLEVSLANPENDEVAALLERFVRAGVDLPIVYPYVSGDDAYKVKVANDLASLAGVD